ncbi:tetratricopeptide repeat protein [Paraflavitalea sp. CAU 1676]|uniref:tetratricopeptide repeat protein n=1 Tax=Paraflavitalea sp. CAU 1676 TaxID=3032598 RepID=UPI0023DC5EFA|nr:tetratricopeptide repeat protein [Paraflavitalea sp. CAU 1676]MDF2192520.1 tetratricopeptide repeat protein [Paraflavitalea sp. CAU 1676]
MDYIYFLLMVLTGLLTAVPATVFLHELGHAVPMLLLSKQPVGLFIGSQGNSGRNLRLKLGRLTMHFHYNPFRWYYGCCFPPGDISIGGQMLYVATGPLVSLATFLVCWNVWKGEEPGGFYHFFLTCATIYSFYTILATAIPRRQVGHNADGQPYGNDGHNFLELIRYSLFHGPFREMNEAINNRDYQLASDLFEQYLQDGGHGRNAYRMGAYIYCHLKQYDRALALLDTIRSKHFFKTYDHQLQGTIYLAQLRLEDALPIFESLLDRNPDDSLSLNAKGYALGMLGRHEEAMQGLNRAIRLAPGFAYAYNNRGFSKILLGQLEAGLADLQKSLDLDDKNGYVFRNLGLYHLKKNEQAPALEYLEKAKAIDADMPLLDGYFQEATSMTGETNFAGEITPPLPLPTIR